MKGRGDMWRSLRLAGLAAPIALPLLGYAIEQHAPRSPRLS
jgi:hypothetical protein